ncbi:MAG: hypothetical protein ACLR94_06755 [Acutalibacteraceae bacterium]
MVVDANRAALQKAADILARRQTTVTVVLQNSAVKAAEYAMCNAVDMVFLRTKLPDMSGEELLTKIKEL